MEYEAVIGLETHVQLKTHSKMWCGCANKFGSPPNTNVCPVCLGLPGVLPVANDEAIRLTALTGLLLNCELPSVAKFDRKNYFYPDSPKNYQVTQYDQPFTRNGHLDFEFNGQVERVRITRAHLEEDVGKNLHYERYSGVDFNRAGVPLLEIVSEPDLRSSSMAFAYLNALTEVLYLGGISDCDMEKGMVRCDVNVSIRPPGSPTLGAKIEIKNMNTFSGVRRALDFEIPRQIDVLTRGGRLTQETRRWDDVSGITEPMRSKEDAHDYRYFPEPDLLPFVMEDSWLAQIRTRQVELPFDRKRRLMRDFNIPAGDAEVLKSNPSLAEYFESAASGSSNSKAVANWIINNLRAKLTSSTTSIRDLKFPVKSLAELVGLVDSGRISSKIAQEVFEKMFTSGESPAVIVDREGWTQVSDTGQIEAICREVIANHPGPVGDLKSGKEAALNFLKGQVMKLSKGKANPALAGEVLQRLIRG